jgi:DNA (cytosine-5)-methyltransferase 1
MKYAVPVIDVFAGPGGLGEGFSAFSTNAGKPFFKIMLSIEKDPAAHRTLELRSFFRQFSFCAAPDEYYSFLRGNITLQDLYACYPDQAESAQKEAWHAALGSGPDFDNEFDHRAEEIIPENGVWVLIGGPPCQAYSIIGRARNKNGYRPEKDERNYLYLEFLKILSKHRPAVFVMENVKGLLSSTIKGKSIFDRIFADLQEPMAVFPDNIGNRPGKYRIFSLSTESSETGQLSLRPQDFIVKCENYGIPQARHRVILLGVREDLCECTPELLESKPVIPIDSVITGLPKLRSGLSEKPDSSNDWVIKLREGVSRRWVRGAERRWGQQLSRRLKQVLNTAVPPHNDRGAEYIECRADVSEDLKWWYSDKKMKGISNHSSRSHMTKDIYRYLFAACFAEIHRRSPLLREYPPDLLPDHKNAKSADFDDRFRVQVTGNPSSTITSHISKDGHYYIHPDPLQCRSLTVREAARLQTFPDNYFFCGKRTQQYVQVGNAVPPLLAYQIAAIVQGILSHRI